MEGQGGASANKNTCLPKPDSLSSIPRMHSTMRAQTPKSCPLPSRCKLWYTQVHVHIDIDLWPLYARARTPIYTHPGGGGEEEKEEEKMRRRTGNREKEAKEEKEEEENRKALL